MIEFLTVLNDNVRLFYFLSLHNPEGPGPGIDHLLPVLHSGDKISSSRLSCKPSFLQGGQSGLVCCAGSPSFCATALKVWREIFTTPYSYLDPLVV